MPKKLKRVSGRPKGKSGLPAPIEGEPFSLIGTLRRTRCMLTVKDAAFLLSSPDSTVYEQIDQGKIPKANLPMKSVRIDPAAWAELLEQDNPHLVPSALRLRKAA